MLRYFACDGYGCEKCVYNPACYWVEMRDTIVSMIREPRGQVIKSMLGFLIFSSKSWSSSQRSSFTSSATYMHKKKKTLTFHIRWNTFSTLNPDEQYHFLYIASVAEGNLMHHTKINSENEPAYFMWCGSESDPAVIQRDDELAML